MNCSRAQKWMLLDQSGELALRRRARLLDHVGGSGGCREYRDRVAALARLESEAAAAVVCPDYVCHRVLESARAEAPRRARALWRPLLPVGVPVRALACAVAVAVMAGGGWWTFSAQGRAERARALSGFLQIVCGEEDPTLQRGAPVEGDLKVLATQLLRVQGMGDDPSFEEWTSWDEAPSGIAPLSHSTVASPARECV